MGDWGVEVSGSRTILVVRRRGRHGRQQDLARDDAGRIIWFDTREAGQEHADRLNGIEPPTTEGGHGCG